jgi:hypothetical protein
LSMFVCLSGSQQSNDLKDALENENEKTKLMEESMLKLDEEMKRSDTLLAQMMPKSVSDKVSLSHRVRQRGS